MDLNHQPTDLESVALPLSYTPVPDVGLEPTATSLRGWRSTD